MFLPIRTDSPLRHKPWMNWALILANVLVFALTELNPRIKARFWLDPHHLTLWSYLTYAFLHANVMHIVGNMLFLYIFGNNVNDKMGNVGYLAFYLGGGIFAGIGHVLTASVPVLGASGAVAAVTGAYLVLFPRSNLTIVYFFWLIGAFEIPSMWVIAFFFLQDVVMNFFPNLFGGAAAVAHTAHIAGTIYGFTICMALLLLKLLPRDQFDILALGQRWHRRRQYRSLVNQGFDPFGHTSMQGDNAKSPPHPHAIEIASLRQRISAAISGRDQPGAVAAYRHLMELDPKQVLPRGAQLDVANQLAHEQDHAAAAGAYERFLSAYPKYDQVEQVELMLGLIYARYLGSPDLAREHLQRALPRLHRDREIELAESEIARINASSPTIHPQGK